LVAFTNIYLLDALDDPAPEAFGDIRHCRWRYSSPAAVWVRFESERWAATAMNRLALEPDQSMI